MSRQFASDDAAGGFCVVRTMARPTKYTPELVTMIVDGIRDGLTDKDAALVAGIGQNTLIRWKERYGDFRDRLAQAHAERSRKWLDGIAAAAPRDWRAYAELLDRCAPDYRKTERREITGPDGSPLTVRFEVVESRTAGAT